MRLAELDRTGPRVERYDLAAEVRASLFGLDLGHVDIVLDLALAHVSADPALLDLMIDNLLQNAVPHHLPADGVIWIRTATRGNRAFLMVDNTGQHLHPDVVSTLTEPFVRARSRTLSTGHGVGLALVASVARSHGAHLSLVGRDGGGISVSVDLKRHQVEPAPSQAALAASSPLRRPTPLCPVPRGVRPWDGHVRLAESHARRMARSGRQQTPFC